MPYPDQPSPVFGGLQDVFSHEHDEPSVADRVLTHPRHFASDERERAREQGVPDGPPWKTSPLTTPKSQWRSYHFTAQVAPNSTHRIQVMMDAPFRTRWLVVATLGFTIRLTEARAYLLLDDIDGDLFTGGAWDAAAKEEQLERLRLLDYVIDHRGVLEMDVTPRPRLLTMKDTKYRFSATVIGEELVSRY